MNRILLLFAIFSLITILSPEEAILAQDYYRDSWQQPEKIMNVVKIKPGMVIGEAGAGEGYFTFHLSERVGSNGRIYANDIKKNVLEKIKQKCDRENIQNITTITGEVDDPLFPEGELDMVIMMRVFHEIENPVKWMKNIIPSLKPDATLVIIDLEPKKAGYGWSHFKTEEQIIATMGETDFELERIERFLDRDNIYIFKPSRESPHR